MAYCHLVGVHVDVGADLFGIELMIMFEPVDDGVGIVAVAVADQFGAIAGRQDGRLTDL